MAYACPALTRLSDCNGRFVLPLAASGAANAHETGIFLCLEDSEMETGSLGSKQDRDPADGADLIAGQSPSAPLVILFGGLWQRESEGAALVDLALHRYLAPMGFDDGTGDRQAQAGSFVAADQVVLSPEKVGKKAL